MERKYTKEEQQKIDDFTAFCNQTVNKHHPNMRSLVDMANNTKSAFDLAKEEMLAKTADYLPHNLNGRFELIIREALGRLIHTAPAV